MTENIWCVFFRLTVYNNTNPLLRRQTAVPGNSILLQIPTKLDPQDGGLFLVTIDTKLSDVTVPYLLSFKCLPAPCCKNDISLIKLYLILSL